jgi:hypothetical protein
MRTARCRPVAGQAAQELRLATWDWTAAATCFPLSREWTHLAGYPARVENPKAGLRRESHNSVRRSTPSLAGIEDAAFLESEGKPVGDHQESDGVLPRRYAHEHLPDVEHHHGVGDGPIRAFAFARISTS